MSEGAGIDRRTLLGTATGLSIAAATPNAALAAGPRATKDFPKGFHWGASTAGHQIEGNNVNADYWVLENVRPTLFAERSGDACDSYHRYREDIALLAGLGLTSYRFSLEWARIEPTLGAFSQAELDYYRRVVDCCREHGVAPAVTFTHFSVPSWFAAAGGWTNPEAPALFARFCNRAAQAMADQLSLAFTMNEPQLPRVIMTLPGADLKARNATATAMHRAAAQAVGAAQFVTLADYSSYDRMVPLLIAGHEQGLAAIKAERSDLPVGVTLSVVDFEPGTEDSDYAALRERACGEWFETVRRTGDFVGVQAYHQFRIAGKGKPLPPPPPLPHPEPKVASSTLARPEALRNCVDYIHGRTQRPIIVTENGLETDDDARRVWHIGASLAGLQETIAAGTPVLGYFHWSLLDNFEWDRGFGPKFGLVAVDRTSFARRPKPSASYLGEIARRNAL